MSLTIDCGEGRCEACSGSGTHHYLIPQENDGERFECACSCHRSDTKQAATCPTCESADPRVKNLIDPDDPTVDSCPDEFHSPHPVSAGGRIEAVIAPGNVDLLVGDKRYVPARALAAAEARAAEAERERDEDRRRGIEAAQSVTRHQEREAILTAENERLREALREIAARPCSGIGSPPSCACRTCIASRALALTPKHPQDEG